MLRISFILMALFSPLITVASPRDQSVGLQQFIEVAIANDPTIKNILNDTEQAEFLGSIDLPSEHPTLENTSQYGIDPDSDDKSHALSTTLTKPFLSIGSEVEVRHTVTSNTDREEQTTGLTYEQHLLNNAFGRDYRLAKESAELNTDIISLKTAEAFEERVQALFAIYFDYQLASLSLKSVERQMQYAQRLYEFVKNKARSAVASDIDVARSEHQVLTKRTELQTLEYELQNHRNTVRAFTGQSYRPMLKINQGNAKELAQLIQTHRPQTKDRQLMLLDLEERKAEQSLTLADRAISPELSAFVGAQWDNSTRFGSESRTSEMIIGLNFSMPIGTDTSKQASKSKAIFEKSEVGLRRSQYLIDSKQQTELLRDRVVQQIELVKLSEERLRNANTIAKGEDKRFRSGRIDLDKLIAAQDLVTSAELSALKSQITLRKAVIEWLAENDKLTKDQNVIAPWHLLE